MRSRIVVGNWKMNTDQKSGVELLDVLASEWTGEHSTDVAVCPPAPYLLSAAGCLRGTSVGLGAQDLSDQDGGAYTGQVSAQMLVDCGCKYVIVGHSERRAFQNETSELVALKFEQAIKAGLTPILCVGEKLSHRENGETFDVILSQISAVIERCGLALVSKGIVAYEPVWAIGTGVSATPDMAQEVHAYIRKILGSAGDKISILYGGSVKPASAEALFMQPDIDGALVGGASLNADDFLGICRAAE